jgi:hypothetical protein
VIQRRTAWFVVALVLLAGLLGQLAHPMSVTTTARETTVATNQIGTGSTADALRNELATGQPTEGVFHSMKADQYINGLSNWLRKNPNASPDDIWAAQGMLQDLIAAMSGQ